MLIPQERLQTLFDAFAGKRIAILGDVMLDRYIWGDVTRISPEAPVPVVEVREESQHPGGASNVALNVRMLGAVPILFGVVGIDAHADSLRSLFRETDISPDHLVEDGSRPTTVKTRVIAHSQHVVRIDRESRADIGAEVRAAILDSFRAQAGRIDAAILQDYNKGVIDRTMIGEAIALCRANGVPVCVDPKFANFFEYRKATIFKPNRKETEDALGRKLENEKDYLEAAVILKNRLACDHVLLTLGEQGMLLLQQDGKATRIPTRARKVADVSGAGDTVVSTLAVSLASGATPIEAATIANIAGGLVCEEVGIVPVEKDKLLDGVRLFNHLE